jgi:PEP-CTERM motif
MAWSQPEVGEMDVTMARVAAAIVIVMGISGSARAGLIIDASQVGDNVVFQTEAGGTLNLAGLSYSYSGTNYATDITPNYPEFGSLPNSTILVDVYTGFTAYPSSFGTGGHTFGSGVGTPFELLGANYNYLEIVSGFTGGAVSFTDTYSDATFSSLGLTPGSYTWSWSSDSVVLNIPASAVPEPTSALLMTVGALCLTTLGWRNRAASRRRL